MSVQYFAVASQKLIWPGATAVLPTVTVAVSVTKAPDVTVVTAFPAEVTASAVAVAAGAAQAGGGAAHRIEQTTARTVASPGTQANLAENAWLNLPNDKF
jgi:hypothetical protein